MNIKSNTYETFFIFQMEEERNTIMMRSIGSLALNKGIKKFAMSMMSFIDV